LKLLWEEGIDVYDSYCQETFCFCVMYFCTINDFPAYGNLSGYCVKGHFTCPICEENTRYIQLEHDKKNYVYKTSKIPSSKSSLP